ncbi:DUF859 family phage minor structural protein [Amedibacillus sp. YH-ame10]
MGFHLNLSLSESNVNIANNTSVVTVGVTCVANDSYSSAYNNNTTSVSVSCDGQSGSFSVGGYNIGLGGSQYLGSKSFTITHNNDGSKSISASATFYADNSWVGTPSASGSLTLTKIARASTFSISGNTMDSPMTISISRASSNFTHTVRYQFGSIVREYSGQATSCIFTPPASDASQIPNTTSGTGTITVTTYSGSTKIGDSKSSNFTLYIPNSLSPSFSDLTVTRNDNGVPPEWGIYVQGKSKATVKIEGASGIYGSSINTYSIVGSNGTSSSSSAVTTDSLPSGTITFTGSIKDSRGKTATREASITVYPNSAPTLTLKAERCNVSGVVSNTGTYLKITPTYSCASINGKNYISSKEFNISTTSYKNTTASSGSSFILGNGDILISKSYDITGIVKDALGQSSGTITIKVPSSSVPVNFRDDMSGVGFGKYAEKVNAIDSAWDIYIKGNKLMTNSDCPFPIGFIITNTLSSFNPNTQYQGTTWVRYAQGRVLVGLDENDADFINSGKTGGVKVHSHSTGSLSLSINQIPSHGRHLFDISGGDNVRQGTSKYTLTNEKMHSYMSSGWTQFAGNENYPYGKYVGGGEAHNHGNTGSAQNLQPYIAVYMWVRTA